MHLIVGILEYASILLIGIGSVFILVDLRTGFDRIFRYFGVSLILISCMAAIDLYTGGAQVPAADKLIGQRILHEIACVFFPFSGTYLMLIAGMRIRWAGALLIGAGICFAPLVPTRWMLGLEDGVVRGGPLYLPLFFPFAVFYIGFSYFVLVRNFLKSQPGQKRFALIHLLAFVILTLSGLLDMIGIVDPSWKLFVSYKIFGILIFGAMSAYVFTERFFLLLQERQETYDRLETLRRRMDGADPMREIGESAAHISHEIKNHLATMKSNTHLIKLKTGDPGTREEADRIERSTERLEGFTRSILNYASATGNLTKSTCCARSALEDCVRGFFADRGENIRITAPGPLPAVLGEKAKLEQVYLNLLKNAFEAGAARVEVALEPAGRGQRIIIADDGPGCSPEQLASLGKPFFTTRKAEGGTGLGIAISRALVEGLGGSISFLARQGREGTGMRVEIELPLAAAIR